MVFLALLVVGAAATLVVSIARVGIWPIGNTPTTSMDGSNNNEPPQNNRPIRFEAVTVPVINNNVLKYKAVYSDNDTAVTVADWIRVLSSSSSSSSNGDGSVEIQNNASEEMARTLTEILKVSDIHGSK